MEQHEALERARLLTGRVADHVEVMVDGEVRQVVDAPENFIDIPAPSVLPATQEEYDREIARQDQKIASLAKAGEYNSAARAVADRELLALARHNHVRAGRPVVSFYIHGEAI